MLEKGGVWSMAEHIRLPVGVDSFEKIRREGFYYVDKTLLIEQLLEECWGGQSVYQTQTFW